MAGDIVDIQSMIMSRKTTDDGMISLHNRYNESNTGKDRSLQISATKEELHLWDSQKGFTFWQE